MNETINLEINGMGIIIYSDFAVLGIKKGEDYFSSNYQKSEQVLTHIIEGKIVGFCTSSPGRYILKFAEGYPEELELRQSQYKLRLGIQVKDQRICVRDLFDLMYWDPDCPEGQYLNVENGFYHVTLFGDTPASGILGDNQVINIYLHKLDKMPVLKYKGVPIFS